MNRHCEDYDLSKAMSDLKKLQKQKVEEQFKNDRMCLSEDDQSYVLKEASKKSAREIELENKIKELEAELKQLKGTKAKTKPTKRKFISTGCGGYYVDSGCGSNYNYSSGCGSRYSYSSGC